MKRVFADTSYYVALLVQVDAYHQRAIDCTKKFDGHLVTTHWVLTELGNYFSAIHLRQRFVGFTSDLMLDQDPTVISADSGQFEKGAKLFAERPDKSWSLVDCISFEMMRGYGIDEDLTADHHFEQAGFKALLLS